MADRVGYKPLMGLAFFFHVASAVVTLAATPMYSLYGHDAAYQCLYWVPGLLVANGRARRSSTR